MPTSNQLGDPKSWLEGPISKMGLFIIVLTTLSQKLTPNQLDRICLSTTTPPTLEKAYSISIKDSWMTIPDVKRTRSDFFL